MRGLYLVTPNWDDTGKLLELTEQALRAGVAGVDKQGIVHMGGVVHRGAGSGHDHSLAHLH